MSLVYRAALAAFFSIAFMAISCSPSDASGTASGGSLNSYFVPSFFPDDPKKFDRHQRPQPKPTLPAVTHIEKPKIATKNAPAAGLRQPGPRIGDDDDDMRTKRKRNSGEAVVRFFSRASSSRIISTASTTSASAPTAVGKRGAGTTRRASQVTQNTLNVTGINPWWSYEEGDIPGVGHWMINAHWQNLIVQSTDFDIPYRGIDLAFRRTYNSLGGHDYQSSDGSTEIGQYGNGWTNTFDAHMSTNDCANVGYSWAGFSGFSVYDVDGARYDYCFNASGQLVPPAGMQGTMLIANPDGGSFFWIKKNGTQYMFYSPYYSGASAAYSGRLVSIQARNRHSSLNFSYSWNGDASSSANLSQIVVAADCGCLQATLKFADVNGQRLLSEVDRPDGAAITYSYDGSSNLSLVSKPGPDNSGQLATQLYGGYHNVMYIGGARAYANQGNEGGYVAFQERGFLSGQVFGIGLYGAMSPGPAYLNDGTNTQLQPGYPTGWFMYRYETVTGSCNSTSYSDSDGHQVVQYIDGCGNGSFSDPGRPTSRLTYNGYQWLTQVEGWDSNNNKISQITWPYNETDYAYDSNGNTIAVAAPQTTTSAGTLRPTKLFTYDAYNNVTAYCDEVATNNLNWNWYSSPPPPGVCPANSVSTVMTWDYPAYQPYGRLLQIQAPSPRSGAAPYATHFAYNPNLEGGNEYGLPVSVTGDPIPEDAGRTPTQAFSYDTRGNVINYSKGVGSWSLSYDGLDRIVQANDPDGYASTTTYFPDGSVATTQSPGEARLNVRTSYAYDRDGDVTSELRHEGCTLASCAESPTRKFYDGADRLIEVQQPHDPRSYQDGSLAQYDGSPWIMRYIYDLSQGGSVSLRGSPTFRAYGNLFKTQSWTGVMTDVRGNSFDAMDRSLSKYTYQPGSPDTPLATVDTYDGEGHWGLRATETKPTGEVMSITYDALARIVTRTYLAPTSNADGGANTTPNEQIVYDPAGRPATLTSSKFGLETLSYDLRGELTDVLEPTAGGITDPAHLAYSYFSDGGKKSLSVFSPTLNIPNVLTYSYRVDGLLAQQTYNQSASAVWNRLYTAGGRLQSQAVNNDFQSRTYDQAGQLATLTVPSGTLSYDYDAEGNPITAGFSSVYPILTAGQSTGSPVSVSNIFNVRGELIQSQYSPIPYVLQGYTRTIPSYGFGKSMPQMFEGSSAVTQNNSSDFINGISVHSDSTFSSGSENSSDFVFDASGRMTNSTMAETTISDGPAETGGGTVTRRTSSTEPAAYDFADHTVWTHAKSATSTYRSSTGATQNSTFDAGPLSIAWGSNGHPVLFTGTIDPNYANTSNSIWTAHWDGDMLLFVSDASGSVVNFKVGLDGDVYPHDSNFSGLNTYDRDSANVILQSSNSSGSSWLTPLNPTDNSAPFAVAARSGFTPPTNSFMQYTRPDGFKLGKLQINGARAFNSNLASWTTPDAYAGEVHDPASQMPFMWNRNNAYVYSDPSGYCVGPLAILCGAAVALGSFSARNGPAITEALEHPGAGRSAAAVGRRGEEAVRAIPGIDIGKKVKIQIGGVTRIPDGLTETTLTEIKNVTTQSYTQQLRDYASFAKDNNLDFVLYVRADTKLSGPLKTLISTGNIIHQLIPEIVQKQ